MPTRNITPAFRNEVKCENGVNRESFFPNEMNSNVGLLSLKSSPVAGGWTWFGGPRVLSEGPFDYACFIRPSGNTLGFGQVVVAAVLRADGVVISEVVLEEDAILDDHNVPAITRLATGELLVGHTGHNSYRYVVMTRVSEEKGSLSIAKQWNIEFPDRCTYVYLVPSLEHSVLMLTRSMNSNWSAVEMNTKSFEASEPTVVFPWKISQADPLYSGRDGNRPYLMIRRGQDNSWLFAITNDHPRAYRNGVFAGRIRGATIEDLDGQQVHQIGSGKAWSPFTELTEILPSAQKTVPWVHDVAETEDNRILVAWSTRAKSNFRFRRKKDRVLRGFHYGVSQWFRGQVGEVLRVAAGSSLYHREEDYVGGIALNPHNPFHAVFSTNALPPRWREKKSWDLWEIHADQTPDSFRRLVSGRPAEGHFRPVFSESFQNSGHCLSYLSGTYPSYRHIETNLNFVSYEPDVSCFSDGPRHRDLPFELRTEPYMPAEETEALRRFLSTADSFLELGAGASTVLAMDTGVRVITTIDTDGPLLDILENRFNLLGDSKKREFRAVLVDTRYAGKWGYPLGSRGNAFANNYLQAVRDSPLADLVLIDGRFRLASFIEIARRVSKPTTILWDDYASRGGYHAIETVLRPCSVIGRMGVFEVGAPLQIPSRLLRIARRSPQ